MHRYIYTVPYETPLFPAILPTPHRQLLALVWMDHHIKVVKCLAILPSIQVNSLINAIILLGQKSTPDPHPPPKSRAISTITSPSLPDLLVRHVPESAYFQCARVCICTYASKVICVCAGLCVCVCVVLTSSCNITHDQTLASG